MSILPIDCDGPGDLPPPLEDTGDLEARWRITKHRAPSLFNNGLS